jgi:hypothetical protein
MITKKITCLVLALSVCLLGLPRSAVNWSSHSPLPLCRSQPKLHPLFNWRNGWKTDPVLMYDYEP